MFVVNDDKSIYATRGDIVFFAVTAEENGHNYKFQPGDIVRIKVYGKKDAEKVLLQKDFPVSTVTESVDINLTGEDTKIGEVISKPKDYWYEIELNPHSDPQTIVGYDEDGAKLFKLFPEGDDIPPYVPKPEEIRTVDTELDMSSERPVQNQAIARAFIELKDGYERTRAAVSELHVTPQMFGAVGDGIVDDTEAFQLMFDHATAGSTIYFPAGTYLINSFGTKQQGAFGYYGALLYQKKDITINFEKGAVLKSKANSDNTNAGALLGIVNCSNIKVFGGELIGELDEHTFASENDTTTFNQSGIWVSSSSNVLVEGLTAHNFIAGCIYVGGSPHSDNVEIRNCLAYHSHYHGIVVEGADNVKIINTTAYDANTNRGFGTSIDVEGISAENVNTNIVIDGCCFGSAEAAALNVNKCKDVQIRNTQTVGGNLVIQCSENVFVSGCYLAGEKLHILQGGSKNIVIDGNKMVNNNIVAQVYSNDVRTQEGIVIRNNTMLFDSAFEDATYGVAFFQLQSHGRADVSIVDNVCRCSNGKIILVKAEGVAGGRGIVVSGNKFFVGSGGSEVSRIYRDLIQLIKLRTEFTGNEIELHLADDVVMANGTSTSTELNLLNCIPNGTDGFKFSNNDIRIYGNGASGITALKLMYTYTELAEAPTKRYADFIGNKIFSDVPNTCGMTVPAKYKVRVYNNIVTSVLSELISESQSGVAAQGNIYDTVV